MILEATGSLSPLFCIHLSPLFCSHLSPLFCIHLSPLFCIHLSPLFCIHLSPLFCIHLSPLFCIHLSPLFCIHLSPLFCIHYYVSTLLYPSCTFLSNAYPPSYTLAVCPFSKSPSLSSPLSPPLFFIPLSSLPSPSPLPPHFLPFLPEALCWYIQGKVMW